MTLVIDAAPLVASADRRDPRASTVQRAIVEEHGELIIPAPVSAEVDYLLGQRLGRSARRRFLTDLAGRRFRVVCLEGPDYDLILEYDQQYSELDVGLADLSLIALAHRFRTKRILTFDLRHFRTVRPVDGGTFTLLPADAS